MICQQIDLRDFMPMGAKIREQIIALSEAHPVGADILEQSADRLVICVPKEGGGVLLAGAAGQVGGDWSKAGWLSFDLVSPQEDQFALALTMGFYREGQDIKTEMPYYSIITGAFPNYPTRISFDFKELACKNGFLPRTPGKLKTVCAGRPMDKGEVTGLYLGARECHQPQTIVITNMVLRDTEPDYPMPKQIMVDELGQWAGKDWPGKTRTVEEMTLRLREELNTGGAASLPDRSRWGGLLTKKLTEGTGFFATHKDEQGKWWLTDPDGYAYLVMSVEGITPSSASVVDEWHDSYAWLPPRNGEFAGAWSTVHGDPTKGRRVEKVETVDFMRINLIRAFGNDWQDAWYTLTERRLKAWGINNIGATGSFANERTSFYRRSDMPRFYFMGRSHGGYPTTQHTIFRDFPDVFSPEYTQNAAVFAQDLENIKNDPQTVGYFMTNEPEWSFINDLEISEMMLASPEQLASKAVFIERMRSKYCTVDAMNYAWKLNLVSFDDLLKPIASAARLSPCAAADLDAFSRELISEYVRVPAQACKAYDPRHLNFGLRYPYISYPNVTAGHEYLDVFDINDYRFDPKPYLDWISSMVDMPVMVSEFHHGALDRGLPVTGIRGVRTQEERGVAYRYYMERGAACPAFVGSVYFTMNDQPVLCNAGQENYNIGFVDICQRPHTEVTDYLRKTAENLYAVHAGEKQPYNRHPDMIPLNAC